MSPRQAPSSPLATLQLLRIVVASLSRSARAIETTSGVTNAQLFLLRQIAAAERLSVTDLAHRIGARQNAVSPVLRRLVVAGLVQRAASDADGRRVELSLTASGRRMLRRVPAPPTEKLLRALESLPPADHHALSVGLASLVDALGLDPSAAPLLFEVESRRQPPARRR